MKLFHLVDTALRCQVPPQFSLLAQSTPPVSVSWHLVWQPQAKDTVARRIRPTEQNSVSSKNIVPVRGLVLIASYTLLGVNFAFARHHLPVRVA